MKYVKSRLWKRIIYEVFLSTPNKEATPRLGNEENVIFSAIDSNQLSYDEWNKSLKPVEKLYPTLNERKRKWYQNGDIIVVGTNDDGVVFRGRMTSKDWIFNYLPVDKRKSRVFYTDVFCHKSLRRKGIAILARHFAQRVAYERSIKNLWSFVKSDNHASKKMNFKLGSEQCGRIYYKSIFGKISVTWHRKDGNRERLFWKP